MENPDIYLAWKEAWLARHETLDEAIALAKEQGGDEYAALVARIISEREARLS